MITLLNNLAALLALASITSFAGPPSSQFVDFDTLPPPETWTELAKTAACAEVATAAKPIATSVGDKMFGFIPPVTVTFRVWEAPKAEGDPYTPREVFVTTIKACLDT